MTTTRTKRGIVAALAVVAALTLAACSSSGDTPSAAPSATGGTETASAQFPVSIENKFGTTEIPAQPERIVTVGFHEQDWLYALGIAPVAVREWYGGYDYATWPWADDARKAVGAEPTVLGSGDLDMEAIAALNPDLIIATWSGITQEQYDLLSQIAPTLAQSGDYADYGMPFDEETRMIAKAVGQVDAGEKIISDIQAKEAEIKDAHPDWANWTAAVTFFYEGQPGAYFSYDPRPALLGTLGINVTDIDKLGDPSKDFYVTVSPENLDKMDSDANVWLGATEPGTQKTVEALPLYPQMNATVKGGQIWSTDGVFEGAFSFASPLSIPYTLDTLVPRFEAAFDGDPATLPEPIVPAS
jgi:iron complex transport system substrate-binding protein